jgi:selenocysteine-specific elongation factor
MSAEATGLSLGFPGQYSRVGFHAWTRKQIVGTGGAETVRARRRREVNQTGETILLMTIDLILGTAGHIDHGKTSLVRALTGVDTDRLPEEKRRGITIELGFAELTLDQYRLGIVDVPGHERFVRNMLAGATGMDLALLVVASDDSIKPQTREHLDILRLLDLRAGVIALTKCDLVESAWLDLVEEEIRELVADTFLADAPIVRTSTLSGMGIDRLRDRLREAAAHAAAARRDSRTAAPFRMAIDRCFTIAGYGTIVTGSVSSGSVQVGDELRIEPLGRQVRVRGLQSHDRAMDEVHRGQRAAVNLAGVHHDEIDRGQELASPGHLVPSRLLTVQLSLIPQLPRPLKHRCRVRVHLGTAELLATLLLLDRDEAAPGESVPAQLFLNQPAVAVWAQPFVLRTESPVSTVGGGTVLNPNAQRLRKPDREVIGLVEALRSPDVVRRASAALYFADLRDWRPEDLPRTAGIDQPAEVAAALRDSGELLEIGLSPTRTMCIHQKVLLRLSDRMEALLRKMHQQNPLRSTLDRHRVAAAFRYLPDPALFDAIVQHLRVAGRIRVSGRGLAVTGEGPKLSANERKVLAELIEIYRQAGIQSPTVSQICSQVGKNQQSVPQLIALAAADGDLVQVAADYYLHAEVDRQLKESLSQRLAAGEGLTLSEIRELLGTTRKYAVPYCEYLDRTGFTRREGDVRFLA